MLRFIRSNDYVDEDNELQLVDYNTFVRACRKGEVHVCPDDPCYLVIVAPILGVSENFAGYEFFKSLRVEAISFHDAFLSPVYQMLYKKYPATAIDAHNNLLLVYKDIEFKAKKHPLMTLPLYYQDPTYIESIPTSKKNLPGMEPLLRGINEELKKISLFQASNPYCPEIFCYIEYKNFIIETEFCGLPEYKSSHCPLTIGVEKFIEVKDFTKTIDYNRFKGNLDIAFKSYELALKATDVKVAIMLLVICIETLFNIDGNTELSFRTSRNAAVFLGNSIENSKEIFNDLKLYYTFRSKIVHSGLIPTKPYGKHKQQYTEIEIKEHVKKLAEYCRSSIVKYYHKILCGEVSHQDFFKKLNESAFGSDPYK